MRNGGSIRVRTCVPQVVAERQRPCWQVVLSDAFVNDGMHETQHNLLDQVCPLHRTLDAGYRPLARRVELDCAGRRVNTKGARIDRR